MLKAAQLNMLSDVIQDDQNQAESEQTVPLLARAQLE